MTASFSSHYVRLHTHSVHMGVYACVHISVWMFPLLTVRSAPARATGNRITDIIILPMQCRAPIAFYCFQETQSSVITKWSPTYQIRADGFMTLITVLGQDSTVSSVNEGITTMLDIINH